MKITIAIDRSAYRLQRVDSGLKMRRIGEVSNQIRSTHADNRIRACFAFIYRHFGKNKNHSVFFAGIGIAPIPVDLSLSRCLSIWKRQLIAVAFFNTLDVP